LIIVIFFFVGKFKFKAFVGKKAIKKDCSQSSNKLSQSNSSQFSMGNMFMFTTFYIGWAVMIMLYSMEWYSRVNCPTSDVSLAKS